MVEILTREQSVCTVMWGLATIYNIYNVKCLGKILLSAIQMLVLLLLVSSITDPDGSGQTEILKALLSLLKTKDGSSSDSDSGEGGEEISTDQGR